MSKKRKRKQRAELYEDTKASPRHTGIDWYDHNGKPIDYSINTCYDNRYLEFFHPFYLMNALNCKKRA